MSTNKQASIATAKFIHEFTARGIPVSIPIDGSLSYDLVIDINGDLNRVQVKSTTRSDEIVLVVKLQRTHLLSERRCYKNYTKDDFDLLAIYDVNHNMCYLVGSKYWENKGTLNLRFKPTRSGQQAGILYASSFTLTNMLSSEHESCINTKMRV